MPILLVKRYIQEVDYFSIGGCGDAQTMVVEEINEDFSQIVSFWYA